MSTKKKTKNTNSAELTNNQANELEVIAKRMDEISRRRLSDGVIRSGVLKGMEPEIRQEALIMSVGDFAGSIFLCDAKRNTNSHFHAAQCFFR
jgi:hypothetical protein